MRVLMVAHTFLPESRGGMENHVDLFAKYLLSQGHEVGVLYRIHAPEKPEYDLIEETREGVAIFKMVHNYTDPTPTPFPFYNRRIEEKYLEALNHYQPDLVHFHHLGELSTSLPKATQRQGIPILLSLHDFWPMCFLSSLRTPDGRLCPGPNGGMRCVECLWLQHRAIRIPEYVHNRMRGLGLARAISTLPYILWDTFMAMVMRSNNTSLRSRMLSLPQRDFYMRQVLMQFDRVISPSRFLIEKFEEWGVPRKKFTHVPNSVSPALLEWRRPESAPLHDPITFGFIGRLYPYKGAHVLIEAFNQIDAQQAKLCIWGDAPPQDKEKYYESLVDLAGSSDHISFEGGFPPERLGQILDQIDALVVPSIWYENNPLVILEAFSMGLPVITSNVGGMSELVDHDKTGLLFRLGDSGDLASKLSTLLDEPERLEQYRANIHAPWTMDELGAAVVRIYQKVLN